jgi:flagellin-like protein
MLKSKKGISPILATLLLIVIAVAAIIVTYAWVMTYVGTQTKAAGTMLTVDNSLTWNSSRTLIPVRNTGTSDVTIIRLYIGISANNYTDVTANSNIGTGITISVKNVYDVVLNWPNSLSTSWQSGQVYYFSITPNSGAAYQFEQTAP